jgi:hypothetical protein
MSMRKRPPHVRLILAVAAPLALALVFAGTAGACPLITNAEVASDLHLSEAQEYPALLLPGPAWAVEGECTVDAWTGKRPVSTAQVNAAITAGTFAVVRIADWRPASALSFAGVELKGFRTTLHTVTEEGRVQILKGLHGTRFPPHTFGAHVVGWKATGPGFRTARAVWSKQKNLRIIAITVREGRKHSAVDALEHVAATAVPAFEL